MLASLVTEEVCVMRTYQNSSPYELKNIDDVNRSIAQKWEELGSDNILICSYSFGYSGQQKVYFVNQFIEDYADLSRVPLLKSMPHEKIGNVYFVEEYSTKDDHLRDSLSNEALEFLKDINKSQ